MTHDDDVVDDGTGAAQERRGLVQSVSERFLSTTRALVDQVAQVGAAGAQAVAPGPVLSSAHHMLGAMRRAVEEVPQVGTELEIVMREIRAKRLMIQAVTAELAVLDDQLEVLERALAPVQAWSNQWGRLQHSLLHALDLPEAPED